MFAIIAKTTPYKIGYFSLSLFIIDIIVISNGIKEYGLTIAGIKYKKVVLNKILTLVILLNGDFFKTK